MCELITYIFRNPSPAFHSVEEVFNAVIPEIAKQLPVSRMELPFPSCRGGVLKNLVSFRKEKNRLYHITGQEYYIALRTGRNTVLTIHDVGSAFSGKWLRDTLVRIFWFWLPALIARRITVISEFSRGELVKLVPFAACKIRVIPNPRNPAMEYLPKSFNAERPGILLMGTKSNKNLERIIPALKDIPCRLVIVGKLSSEQLSLLDKTGFYRESNPLLLMENEYHETPGLKSPKEPVPVSREDVRVNSAIRNTFANYHNLPYKEILALYRECDLLCFASTYEGFGLPILEAQATGRAVVTSTVASMPEVAGGGACLVDPFSVDAIREGVSKVIREEAYRETLISKGLQNVERFRVEKIAAGYLEVYNNI